MNLIGEISGSCFSANSPDRISRQYYATQIAEAFRQQNLRKGKKLSKKAAARHALREARRLRILAERDAVAMLVAEGRMENGERLTLQMLKDYLQAKNIAKPKGASRKDQLLSHILHPHREVQE
jgi:hypothetical protein